MDMPHALKQLTVKNAFLLWMAFVCICKKQKKKVFQMRKKKKQQTHACNNNSNN